MKVEYNGIMFDEFSIETTDGDIIDISKVEDIEGINLSKVRYAWTYICKECADKHHLDLSGCSKEPSEFVCYCDGCYSKKDVYSVFLSREEISKIVCK